MQNLTWMAKDLNPLVQQANQNAAQYLRSNKEKILKKWVSRVRKENLAERHEPPPVIIDTLPVLLDQITEVLAGNIDVDTSKVVSTSEEHGGERARLTNLNVESLVQEYQILRE